MPRGSGSSFTGANAIPLGPRNPAIGAKRSFSSVPPPPSQPSLLNLPRPPPPPGPAPVSGNAAEALRAAQAAAASLQAKKFANAGASYSAPPAPQQFNNNTQDERGRPRKKRSRWGDPERKTDIPGIPSSMPANLTSEQQRAYIVQLQIEDLTRKLKTGDLGIPANPEDRSPSPEPIYNNEGKRLNTREYRTRKKTEEDRHKLIQDMIRINENYKPPMDYKPPIQRISEQIPIPADLNPSINFVGLLIGPRGNTLKKIEKDSNCKIMIRGKGSVKEGKIGRKDGMPLPGEDEPLHALVTGTKLEDVQKATAEINRIIKQGIEQPEGQNDLRKNQLMELARLNGTLRDDQMPREREWLRPENQNITNTTVCTKCGGRGHLAQDCVAQAPSVSLQQQDNAVQQMSHSDKAKMDSEYLSLMAELGEGPPPSAKSGNQSRGPNPWVAGNTPKPPPLMGIRQPNPINQNQYGGQNNRWMQGNQHQQHGQGNYRGGGNMGGGYSNNQGSTDYHQGYQQDFGSMGGNNMGQMQGNMWMGQQGYDGNMGWQDPSGGMMNPPPPPPGGSSQPPPPPGSGPDDSGQSGWQGQWGGNNGNDGGNQGGNYGGGNQGGSYGGGNQGGNYGGQNMMGYGNMGWGMWGGGNMGGMNQPPIPPGPGPVPPPPPGSDDSKSGKDQSGDQQQWNMSYGNMGYGMGMGYGMPPAPPPPPPSS